MYTWSFSDVVAFVDFLLLLGDLDLVHHRVEVDHTKLTVTPSKDFIDSVCVFL